MKPQFPEQLKDLVDRILEAEIQISYSTPEPYNAFVADRENVTAVSASGRIMSGSDEVKAATTMVSKGNVGESGRFVEYISGEVTDEMMYALIKTGVTIHKDDGSTGDLCWVITFVFRRMEDGSWMLLHRHNTRAKP